MSERAKKAEEYFMKGYNCAQSVVLAYADIMGMSEDELARMVTPLGGGVGRLREVCGAVSGMCLVYGSQKGNDDPENDDAKAAVYETTQKMVEEFKQEHGSFICRDLLRLEGAQNPVPEKRTKKYYEDRPCAEFVAYAAEIVEKYI